MKKNIYLMLSYMAAKIANDKKGSDILLLNVKRLTSITDYLLIVTINSSPQMKAIIDAIEKSFKETINLKPTHRDGKNSLEWAVLDYGGLIIHIMSQKARSFYALEKIWQGSKKIPIKI